ncbi:MAG: L,D-transpeptidase [Kiritimatiellae bacterium]|nr:L,D-transpeptidase [Kiritimatiellia bacterium]
MQPRTHVDSPETLFEDLPPDAVLWAVDILRQQMFFLTPGRRIGRTPVSTAAQGFGNEPGSNRTPLGWHRAAGIIGRGAPLGQRFESREPVGEPLPRFTGGTGDAILSRIVPLEGLVPGLNHHSRARHIYIHGTDQEERLGTPCSHGCIRVGNQTLADWIDQLGPAPSLSPPLTLPYVWVGEIEVRE